MGNDFYDKYYGDLVGKTILSVVTDEEGVYGLRLSDGVIAWIHSDEEGNGAGFLFIEEE